MTLGSAVWSFEEQQAFETAVYGLLDRDGYKPTVGAQIHEVGVRLAGGEPGKWYDTDTPWVGLLSRLRALALKAASPLTPPATRSAEVDLLHLLAGAGLTDGSVRAVLVAGPARATDSRDEIIESLPAPGTVLETPAGRAVPVGNRWCEGDRALVWFVERAAPGRSFGAAGEPGETGGLDIRQEVRPAGAGGPDVVRAVLRLLDERGPAPWRPESAANLVARTGMSHAEAVLLLVGLVHLARLERNFLSPAERDLLGVSVADARAARDALSRMDRKRHWALLNAALPDDPADLWQTGPDVARVAEVWNGFFGRRIAIPDAILTEAARLLPDFNGQPSEVLRGLTSPDTCEWLHDAGNDLGRRLPNIATGLAWLAYRLPAGDPVRAALPAAYRRVAELLASPDLRVELGIWSKKDLPELPALEPGPRDKWGRQTAWIRPARLTGADDPALGLRLLRNETRCHALRLLLTDGLARLMDSIDAGTQPAGSWPQDPTLSTPDLVTEVAAHHGVPADAAAYYLQLLALPDPTDRNVRRWTGWSTARLAKARTALVAAKLVIEEKRPRAGRSVFLPGDWRALDAPNLPTELWKSAVLPEPMSASLLVVPRPVDEQFRLAWRRVVDGDAPRFDNVGEQR